jgi:hypothetical protein
MGMIPEPCSTILATRTSSTPSDTPSFHPTGFAISGEIRWHGLAHLKRAWMCVRQMRPPGRGTFGFLKIAHWKPQPSRLHRVRQGARCEGATEPTVALRLGLWERTARTEILEQLTSDPRILSADVADAIEALEPERRTLPVAFDKNAIVQKLVGIADEDGIVHVQTAVAARSMTRDQCPLGPPDISRGPRSAKVRARRARRCGCKNENPHPECHGRERAQVKLMHRRWLTAQWSGKTPLYD